MKFIWISYNRIEVVKIEKFHFFMMLDLMNLNVILNGARRLEIFLMIYFQTIRK